MSINSDERGSSAGEGSSEMTVAENGKDMASGFFRSEQSELTRWPYAIHAIDQSLDADLIEGRGKQLLFQSLSHRNTVAFIGSGVSMAYGRLSWSEWLDRQLDQVGDAAGAFMKCAEQLIAYFGVIEEELNTRDNSSNKFSLLRFLRIKNTQLEFTKSEIERLLKTFDNLRSSREFAGGDIVPITFQVAEQLHSQLHVVSKLVLDDDKANRALEEDTEETENNPLNYLPRDISDRLKKVSKASQWHSVLGAIQEFYRQRSRPGFDESFSTMAKLLLVDEMPHADEILGRILHFDPSGVRPSVDAEKFFKEQNLKSALGKDARNLKRNIRGIRELRERYRALRYFQTDSFITLQTATKNNLKDFASKESWSSLLDTLGRELSKNKKGRDIGDRENPDPAGPKLATDRTFVAPSHRFVLEMLAALHERPAEMLDSIWKQGRPHEETEDDWELPEDSFKSRTSIIDADLDPLAKLVDQLGIKRFLTLNYDFEIERLFQDRGYRRFAIQDDLTAHQDRRSEKLLAEDYRVDGVGGVLRDASFQRDRAADLFSFSFDDARSDAEVYHLHGHATEDSPLVVTERDYMDLYLRNDRYRDVVNEAIESAFSSNPLLLVGLGLKEADVLRPLRQFMSDQAGASSRTTIALFPADKDESSRARDSAGLYLRYGVHTVYYGSGTISVKGNGGTIYEQPVDWLHRIMNLVNELREINEAWLKPLQLVAKSLFSAEMPSDEMRYAAREMAKQWERPNGNPFHYKNDDHHLLDRIKSAVGRREIIFADEEKTGETDKNGDKDVLSLLFGRWDREIEPDDLGNLDLKLVACRFLIPRADALTRKTEKAGSARSDRYLVFERELIAHLLRTTVATNFEPLDFLSCAEPEVFAFIGKPEESREDYNREKEAFAGRVDRVALYRLIREIHSRIVGLNGVANSIFTGVLCASLDLVESEWQNWWYRWKLSPPHRRPKFHLMGADKLAEPDDEAKRILPLRYTRHLLDNAITRFDDCENVTFFASEGEAVNPDGRIVTGVRSFDNFLEAVRERAWLDRADNVQRDGRRMHLVAAHRGLGKGTFLSAFLTPRGLAEYVQATSGNGLNGSGPEKDVDRFLSAILINFSFSTEVASSFDMLCEALIDAVTALTLMEKANGRGADEWADLENMRDIILEYNRLCKREEKDFEITHQAFWTTRKRISDDLSGLSRMHRLKALMNAVRQRNLELPVGHRCRILIGLSAIELLDYMGGMPKNREVQEILDHLTGDGAADIPFDLVLIGNEQELGPPFVMNTAFMERYKKAVAVLPAHALNGSKAFKENYARTHGKLKFVPMTRPGIDRRGIAYVRRREQRSEIAFHSYTQEKSEFVIGDVPPSRLSGVAESHLPTTDGGQYCSVYFARPMKPESLLIDNFLPLAVILFVKFLVKRSEKRAKDVADGLADGGSASFKEFYKCSLSRKKLDKLWKNTNYVKREYNLKRTEIKRLKKLADGLYASLNSLSKNSEEIRKLFNAPRTDGRGNRSFEEVLAELGSEEDLDNPDRRFVALKDVLFFRYQSERDTAAFKEWREIRYILRSNRYCLTVLLAAAERIAFTEFDILDGAKRAEAFIRKTIDRVSAVGEQSRGPVVIEQALAAYDQFHVIGEPRYDMELQRLILRHLAVIGTPCSADVLVRAPQIRAYFDKLTGKYNIRRSRKLQLIEALTELTRRGLMFRIHPQPNLKSYWDGLNDKDRVRHFGEGVLPEGEFRYGLHRLVQRLIIQKMGAGPREFISLNSFAPSLYASMPADLPRLTPDAYHFLRTLVASFSQYPDRRKGDPGLESWHFGGAPLVTRVQALRAAMSIIRSTFSVAVVSRFEDYKLLEPKESNPLHGYFEMYRIQVRWLIRKGFRLSREDQAGDVSIDDLEPYNPETFDGRLSAFYRDEIVWLYNECGLICLVQGNVLDAVALLRNAMHLNSKIEGEVEGGAHQNRISLNLAIALIERGRIDAAQERLRNICRSEEQYSVIKGRIWHLAYGYLGLVSQIKGDLETASAHFDTAIGVLRTYGDSRACSAFCRHLGDLERVRQNFPKAREHIREAIGFAEAGGHEDKHKRARLSLVRLDMAEDGTRSSDRVRELFARIDLISEYAEVMEMPSLLSEALTVKAELLLEQGETTLAGKLLSQAMSMTRRNGMGLRLNSAMTIYARVLAMRGMKDQARQLLFSCLEMAKRHKNQLAIQRVEAAFDQTKTV